MALTKCLSIRQPWAALCVLGKKRIEIRAWRAAPAHRGELLIHAGRTPDTNIPGTADFAPFDREVYRVSRRFGGIIGKVNMIDVVEYTRYEDFERDVELHRNPAEWWRPDLLGFVYADPVVFTRIYYVRGQLGFFDLDLDAVVQENREWRENRRRQRR